MAEAFAATGSVSQALRSWCGGLSASAQHGLCRLPTREEADLLVCSALEPVLEVKSFSHDGHGRRVEAGCIAIRGGCRAALGGARGMTSRYALYLAPGHAIPLWLAASTWLGRDPAAPRHLGPRPLRTEPWRYGFHATLKPPLRLAAGHPRPTCSPRCSSWRSSTRPSSCRLAGGLAGWLPALRLVQAIARAPASSWPMPLCACSTPTAPHTPRPSASAILSPGLNAAQREHVLRWGYAHVFEHWRLHFTLTDRLDALPELERAGLRATAATHFAAALAMPCRIESLALSPRPRPASLLC